MAFHYKFGALHANKPGPQLAARHGMIYFWTPWWMAGMGDDLPLKLCLRCLNPNFPCDFELLICIPQWWSRLPQRLVDATTRTDAIVALISRSGDDTGTSPIENWRIHEKIEVKPND